MKRFFSLVVLLSAMTMAMQAQNVKFGVKGGLDIQDMKFDETVFDTENKMGWFVGPTLQVSLPIGGLGVDIAGLYDQKETKVNGETIDPADYDLEEIDEQNFNLTLAWGASDVTMSSNGQTRTAVTTPSS